jgi:hypothetical protein
MEISDLGGVGTGKTTMSRGPSERSSPRTQHPTSDARLVDICVRLRRHQADLELRVRSRQAVDDSAPEDANLVRLRRQMQEDLSSIVDTIPTGLDGAWARYEVAAMLVEWSGHADATLLDFFSLASRDLLVMIRESARCSSPQSFSRPPDRPDLNQTQVNKWTR